MDNGIAIVIGSLLIGAGIAGAGYVSEMGKDQIAQQKLAACWGPGITSNINSLATQEALIQLKASYPNDMSQKDQDSTSKSFSATLSDYASSGASDNWSTINCNASIAYTYDRPDGTTSTTNDGNLISYTVHPAAGGWDSEMSGTDIPLGVVAYTEDPNPPAPPVPTAPTPSPAVAIPPEVADFDQGHADRVKYENWVNGLEGPEQQGAIFWSSQRSLTSPESCVSGATNAFPDDASSLSSFQNGCQEALDMLELSDVKRKTDELYKAGWNAPLASAGGAASQTQ